MTIVVKLQHPFMITPRLLPGVRVGMATISIQSLDRRDQDGRPEWAWFVDFLDESFEGNQLWGACHAPFEVRQAMRDLLAFLGAFASAENPDDDLWDLFPDGLRTWARYNDSEFGYLEALLNDQPYLITQDAS